MKALTILTILLCVACAKTADTTATATETASATTESIAATDTTPAEDLVPAAPTGAAAMDTFSMPTNLQTTASGLQYTVDTPGTGAQPQPGQTVAVHYTGWLTDGTKFDSSRDRGTPIEFPLGQGRVIKGWDEGIGLMKVGEKRTLVIPSSLGYGPRGMGGVIPPDATLVFKVELVSAQ